MKIQIQGRIIKLIWLVMAITSLTSCTKTKKEYITVYQERCAIMGHVTNSTSGARVGGASVTISPTYRTATTDDAGFYLIENIDPGHYHITARKFACIGDSAEVSIEAGDVATKDFNLIAASVTFPMADSNWRCAQIDFGEIHYVQPEPGVYESVSDGLKIYGTPSGGGALIYPNQIYSINNAVLYVKWMANGGGGYMRVGPEIYSDNWSFTHPNLTNLSTYHSYMGSYVITEGTWYYTRFVINSSTSTCITATGNYDIAGGIVVQSATEALDREYSYFYFSIWDCTERTAAYGILGEAYVQPNVDSLTTISQ
jgi:hypothetical protein